MSKAKGVLAPSVILDGYAAHSAMERLANVEHPVAERTFHRIQQAWILRGVQSQVTLALSPTELQLFKKLGATTKPKLVEYRYLAIYRHPDHKQEVRVRSVDRPPKRRTFRVPGHGNKKFIRTKLYRIRKKESSNIMAKTTKTKAKNKKAAEVDDELDVDDLEGLDELDELEDDDVEEPDEVEEDEDEEEDEEPAPKKSKKAAKPKTKAKSKKKAKVVEEDDEDEDDEVEEEEVKPKKKGKTKAASKTKAKKGKSAKSDGGPAAGRTTKELTGGVGTAELAEAASEIAEVEITGREVRVYLRQNDIPKDEEHGRYVWPSETSKKFTKLAKQIAAHYGEDEDDE